MSLTRQLCFNSAVDLISIAAVTSLSIVLTLIIVKHLRDNQKLLQTINLTQTSQRYLAITDLFTKTISQLGSESITVRMGALYALERIARTTPELHWQIIQIMTGYIRATSPRSKITRGSFVEVPPASIDIQITLEIINNRDRDRDPPDESLNLSYCNLAGVNLNGADLSGINFTGTNLNNASLNIADLSNVKLNRANLCAVKFYGSNLSNVKLIEANLTNAGLNFSNFSNAKLQNAKLTGANLAHTNLKDANLIGANLKGTQLHKAKLIGANLDSAELLDANLNGANLTDAVSITASQVKTAKNWEKTKYSSSFSAELSKSVADN